MAVSSPLLSSLPHPLFPISLLPFCLFQSLPLLFTAFPSLQRAPGWTSPVPHTARPPRPPCLGTAVPGASHPPAPFPGCRSPWDAASGSARSGITSRPGFPGCCGTGVSAGFSAAPSMARVSHSAVQGVLCWGRGPEVGQVTTSHPCPMGLHHVHQFRDKPNVCNNQSVLGTSGVFLPALSQDSGRFMV